MPCTYVKNSKVFVALSGGVDSSVAAALLKEKGYDVTGVFIRVWEPEFIDCTWRKDRHDAMRVCAQLEIPFLTFDFEEEYKRDVIDYMLREYEAGRTPNPDVMCNTHIKFGAFLKRSLEMGADYIATGHHARKREIQNPKSKIQKFELLTARDVNKDQSYFLWGLGQKELKHCLFPIGAYEKSEVRQIARHHDLPTAEKKDSQGLCFLGELDMREFLSHFVKERKGEVRNEKGEAVGEHDGAVFYTLGQRHGFRITAPGASRPHYVVGKDMTRNILTVAHDVKEKTDNDNMVALENVRWVSGTPPHQGAAALWGRSRYRQQLYPCRVESVSQGGAVVSFTEEKPLAPPGQSLVLYKKLPSSNEHQLLGGGIIET